MPLSSFDLQGKVALVTGGGRGLGLEIARLLAIAGARVLINGRKAATLQRAADDISADVSADIAGDVARENGAALPLAFDITDPSAVDEAIGTIRREHGRLDILVNNVGQRDRRGLFEFEMEAVRRLVEADLIAPFNLSREAARMMVEQGGGRIVNITSIAGPIAAAGDAAYVTAKGGLEAFTRALAAELGPHGITVNAVAPGFFATETNRAMAEDPAIADWLTKRTSLGRWAEPREIAGAVLFLVSPAASYVTGQVLAVDGGYLAHF